MRALIFSSGSFIDHLADSLGFPVASLSNLSGRETSKGSGYEFAAQTCM